MIQRFYKILSFIIIVTFVVRETRGGIRSWPLIINAFFKGFSPVLCSSHDGIGLQGYKNRLFLMDPVGWKALSLP